MTLRNSLRLLVVALTLLLNLDRALAQKAASDSEVWSLHGQATVVSQRHGRFTSPYEGENSLRPVEGAKTTKDVTLYLGVRAWQGAEFYLNPEFDQGFGLSNTLGVAGFTSGEAYKVGHRSAYGRLQRAFLRQTLSLGDATTPVESAANQLAGPRADDNLTFTLGKFSVADLFDTNSYAHDPRADFLNWSVIDAGAFDYAADAWGYTLGFAAEWNQRDWTFRSGLFALSREPNSPRLDAGLGQRQWIFEGEYRMRWGERAGKVKLLGYSARGRMANYDEAVAFATSRGQAVDAASVRRKASKTGFSVNIEQELLEGVGAFARFSRNDGKTEAFDFTDINRSLSAGLSLSGKLWNLPGHTVGLALASNGLSGPARRYFAAGGLGILVGDGRLPNYASERIVEAYYAARLVEGVTLSLDWQQLRNPGYNTDRGPAAVLGVRLHAEL